MTVLPTDPLPSQVDVAVIGAGLSGLAITAALASRGVAVSLISRNRAFDHHGSFGAPGLLTPGLPEAAWRLAEAIGVDRTRELYTLGLNSVAIVRDLGVPSEPAVHAALSDREREGLEKSAKILQKMGLEPEMLDGESCSDWIGGAAFSGGLRIAQDRSIDLTALGSALLRSAQQHGAAIHGERTVNRVEQRGPDLALRLGSQTVRAHVVIMAAGAGLRELDPWFDDKIIPVREHALRLAPVAHRLRGGRAQLGYIGWRQDEDGSTVVSGCRWATPHMEVYESDASQVSTKVLDKVLDFAERHLPGAGTTVTDRWARIDAHTCDGLPIVGPLPGDPTRLVCAGFQGNAPALALAAAHGLVRGLLDGRSDLPDGLTPGRFT